MTLTPDQLYAAAVALIEKHGWRRIEGDAWWWHENKNEEASFCDAFESALAYEGVDTREEPR